MSRRILPILIVAAVATFFWWRRNSDVVRESSHASAPNLRHVLGPWTYSLRAIGLPAEGTPWIADLAVCDLDQDGLMDVIAADARRNRVGWIRQKTPGVFDETSVSEAIAAPAHVSVVDMDGDGDLDILVASMGLIPPNNNEIGAVVLLENNGSEIFTQHTVLKNVARVSSVEAADLDRDGKMDLVVGQFGYLQGELRWLRNEANGQFTSNFLSGLPGVIRAPVVDLDSDGDLDIVALISQDTEEVHAYLGDGKGGFTPRVLYGSTNKDFGSSGLCIADLNNDTRPDIVFTNGDGFDYATPGSRPWHGVQWLENLGNASFRYQRIAAVPGCYSPLVTDLDGDGDSDVVVTSAFNDWSRSESASLVCLENDGSQRFTQRILAHRPTHLVAVDAIKLPNARRMALVTSAFMFYPPYHSISRVTLWEPLR